MKVLVYPHDLGMGGSQTNATELAAAVRQFGVECTVFGRPDTLNARIAELGLDFVGHASAGRGIQGPQAFAFGTDQILDEVEHPLHFLEMTETGEGVRIFIGSENKLFSLSGSTLVVSPYMNADRKIIGAIGVIGPTRLNYGRIVPIVDYTAQLVGRLLSSR